MKLGIREATGADERAIREVILAAFGPEEGGEIVELVAAMAVDPSARPLISRVAESEGEIVGHVMFSPVRVESAPEATGVVLAPLCVAPGYQGRGIGAALVREGLTEARRAGVALAFVLGDPAYYERFGFRPAGALGLDAPHPLPDEYGEAWRVLELCPGGTAGVRGRVVCCEALMPRRFW